MTNLDKFVMLSDAEAGQALGFSGRRANSRGAFARRIAHEIARTPESELYGIHDITRGLEKEALNALFAAFPYALAKTEGYLPGNDAVMAVVAHRLGSAITSENLERANACCSEVVRVAIAPRLRRFVRETLGNTDTSITLDEDQLIEFLIGPYSQFSRSTSAGLVSVAGNLNEALVMSALRATGVQAIMTGTEGNADIQILTRHLSPPQTLNIEVKSYGARERLLRGLHDCNTPKIGVGFFNKSSEFNAARTGQLLGTNASAIYLPVSTLTKLDDATRSRQNAQGGIFYRPLNRLGADMERFADSGVKAFGQ